MSVSIGMSIDTHTYFFLPTRRHMRLSGHLFLARLSACFSDHVVSRRGSHVFCDHIGSWAGPRVLLVMFGYREHDGP